jgi:hypothetical protein
VDHTQHRADRQLGADLEARAADDQRANPVAVGTVPDRAHDSDDLLDGRRVGRILLVLVARRAAAVVAGHRRRRAATPGSVQQNGFPESSLWMG